MSAHDRVPTTENPTPISIAFGVSYRALVTEPVLQPLEDDPRIAPRNLTAKPVDVPAGIRASVGHRSNSPLELRIR
jgi:hypothetical protein